MLEAVRLLLSPGYLSVLPTKSREKRKAAWGAPHSLRRKMGQTQAPENVARTEPSPTVRSSSWSQSSESTPIRIPQRMRQAVAERQQHRLYNERRAKRASRSRSWSADSTATDSPADQEVTVSRRPVQQFPSAGRRRKRPLQTSLSVQDDRTIVLVDCTNCGAAFPVERYCESYLSERPMFCGGECKQSTLARQSFQLEPGFHDADLDGDDDEAGAAVRAQNFVPIMPGPLQRARLQNLRRAARQGSSESQKEGSLTASSSSASTISRLGGSN